jgi:NADH-quinone oxidoreductase subunit L
MDVAILVLPLLAAIVAGFGARLIGARGAQLVTCGALLTAAGLAIAVFIEVALGGAPRTTVIFSWLNSGTLQVAWSVRVDSLTGVMLVVVTVVSAMVHVYSVGYMSHDPGKARFMAYLSLFTFMMLMLVTADNFVQMFFGWEGVGLASYLLIGFWYEKRSASGAAMKAFLVNRVGDFGFVLGIAAVYFLFETVQFDEVFAQIPNFKGHFITFLGVEVDALTATCLLLFVGAMGKSAQLGLHTWLPDAMEGPTPVSALIHAATMVTAGVFMLARLSPMFEAAPYALQVVALIGAFTAFVAATIGLTQFDIKRVIAYSTMSQLGYMFFAAGVSAYGAAIFHLMTHAFFKALLFLGAGSVIHALSDEQDMRKMGGIAAKIKWTYLLMWIGSLALAGMPFFAGYYSKDAILEAAFASHNFVGQLAYWLGIAAAFMTAFYSWRLLLMTFHGKARADSHVMAHIHESPPIMLIPLVVLAIGAIFAGWFAQEWFIGEERGQFWGGALFVRPEVDPIEAMHHLASWVKLLPFIVGVAGILLAYIFYVWRPALPSVLISYCQGLYRFLLGKWYVDELYEALFVRPTQRLAVFLWRRGDEGVIDPYGPDGAARLAARCAQAASQLQTGYLYHYALAMVFGVAALMVWFWYGV